MKKLLLVLLAGVLCSCGDDITKNTYIQESTEIDVLSHFVEPCEPRKLVSDTKGNIWICSSDSSWVTSGTKVDTVFVRENDTIFIREVDTVTVTEMDTIIIGESVYPIFRAGLWRDTSTSPVKVNCGEDTDRIKSVDVDAYIEFSCSLNIDPGRGNTVKLKVIRTAESIPNGWVIWQSFDGERATVNESSGPAEFGVSNTMLQVRIMPPSRGFVNIEMRVEDADNVENYFIIPFLAIRSR